MGAKGLSVYVDHQQFLFLGEVWRLSYREEKSARKKVDVSWPCRNLGVKCITPRVQHSMLSSILFFIEIGEMINFELGKEIKKDVFRLVTSMGQRKNSESQ